jgi:hypothetical protein
LILLFKCDIISNINKQRIISAENQLKKRGGFIILKEQRKKLWVRILVGLMTAAIILPAVVMIVSNGNA